MSNNQKLNAQTIELELAWFSSVLNTRLKTYFQQDSDIASVYEIQPPDINLFDSAYAKVVKEHHFLFEERIILILALIPHIRPELLDVLWLRNTTMDRRFSEFGGLTGHNHQGFLPTGETAVFILAENNLNKRFNLTEYFKASHAFGKNYILHLNKSQANEPFLSGALCMSNEYVNLLTNGFVTNADHDTLFPARLLTTPLNWDDMVLDRHVLEDLEDIKTWVTNQHDILNSAGLKNKLKPGHRALFSGPSGTGKTTTACLIGKTLGLAVYQMDLSQVILNTPDETEKILTRIFDIAQRKKAMLLFNESDALFGRRESHSSANNRYSNQVVAHFLQLIEDYDGLVILTTNFASNMDEAFARRFQSNIYFAMPSEANRLRIWQNAFSGDLTVDSNTDWYTIAHKYEISGGSIINVLSYCTIKALQRKNGEQKVMNSDIEYGIRRELKKFRNLV